MRMASLIMLIYIILILVFVSKAIQASARKKSSHSLGRAPQRSTFQNNTYQKSSQQKTDSSSFGGSYIETERKKEHRKKFRLFGSLRDGQDVDCDLDERIFGPKGQHKDIF